MKIKRLDIHGFRSLRNFSIEFDDDLTVIVGENDAGKTSLIDCLKVITQDRQVLPDDLTIGCDELEISVEVDDFVYKKKYKKDFERIEEVFFQATPTEAFLTAVLARLSSVEFDCSLLENIEYLKRIAQLLGISVRSNSNFQNVKSNLVELIENRPESGLVIQNAKFPQFNNIQLDGRQFENIPAFFKEVFIKDKQASIWGVPISEGTTMEDFVREHLEQYSSEVAEQIKSNGILDKLKIFIRDLTEIKVEPVFLTRDLNVDAKVKFLENGNEINIDKKGDGTKRRITMALLEFKKEQSLVPGDQQSIYLLDEPDTHLHVRAQLDLVETVRGFASSGNQIILTTHSPFVVNAISPSQIRLLHKPELETTVRCLRNDPSSSSRILQSLGIENIHLFFSRKIILVEGETEEEFLSAYYLAKNRTTLSADLIKVINVKGVGNISGFARAILEFHDPQKIYILCDMDALDSPELSRLITELGIPSDNKFFVGDREFEDAFSSRDLFSAWEKYCRDLNVSPPERWTVGEIDSLKRECAQAEKKFSKELKSLNAGGTRMTKPIFGRALGGYDGWESLPEAVAGLLIKLS